MQHQDCHVPSALVFLKVILQKQRYPIPAVHQPSEGDPQRRHRNWNQNPTASPHSALKPTSIYIPTPTSRSEGKQKKVYLLGSKHIYGNKAGEMTKFGGCVSLTERSTDQLN